MRLSAIVAMVVAVSLAIGVSATKRAHARLRAESMAVDRVDMGLVLRVVRRDPTGQKLIRKMDPMAMVREHRLGGMCEIVDGEARYIGPSANPVIWHCSEAQENLILHGDDMPLWTLIEGSEGSGKTVTVAMWLAVRALEFVGENVEIGLTAPTMSRLGHVKKAIGNLWPSRWFSWSEKYQQYRFHVGPMIQLVSAVRRSEAGGSPIQGANWVAHAGDELQDHFEREADIEARGRAAEAGRYKRINSSTPKDLTAWRNFRALCQASASKSPPGPWSVVRMLGMDSPFVPATHWDNLINGGTMTEREIRRRIHAEDVGPERQVYHCWDRAVNLCRIPDGAIDVTRDAMRVWGPNIGMLIGHDPGKRQHVSEFLKAYRFPSQPANSPPRWFVVDEVTSPESTVEAHVQSVLQRARARRCNLLDPAGRPSADSPQVLVRIDPHTQGGDEHPGRDLYTRWRSAGLVAKAAAYRPSSVVPQTIKRESRIDLINTLLSASAGSPGMRSRLFVACDDMGRPAAPKLVEALESMERNAGGEAEAEAKDADDMSHWPAALGYGLWQVEAPRLGKAA